MSSQVPSITVLRERATQLLGRGCVRGQLKAMMAGAFAAKNAGTPLDPESTSQELVTQCQGLINQADQDVLAILVRELLEFVENGGGGGGDAPAVIAPFPGIGEEGVFYSQQVRTTGATPQTFAVTDGALPTGWTLNADSGVISGTSPSPNGGLWEGEITITNTAGDVVYPFSILMDGTVASATYGPISPNTDSLTGGVLNTISATLSGSTGGYPSFPINCAFVGTPNPLLNATIDADTGEVTYTPDDSLVGNVVTFPTVRFTNYFGHTDVPATSAGASAVLAPVYWGEWHGALPGSFTSSDIKTGLFDNLNAGPRIENGLDSVRWIQESPWLEYPSTGIAYARVLAVPHGLFIGNIVTGYFPVGFFVCDISDIFIPCADLTPAWPTPYQSGLVIDSVTYDIYVVTARTASITLLGNSL